MQAGFSDTLGPLVVNNDGFSALAKGDLRAAFLFQTRAMDGRSVFLLLGTTSQQRHYTEIGLLCLVCVMANQD